MWSRAFDEGGRNVFAACNYNPKGWVRLSESFLKGIYFTEEKAERLLSSKTELGFHDKNLSYLNCKFTKSPYTLKKGFCSKNIYVYMWTLYCMKVVWKEYICLSLYKVYIVYNEENCCFLKASLWTTYFPHTLHYFPSSVRWARLPLNIVKQRSLTNYASYNFFMTGRHCLFNFMNETEYMQSSEHMVIPQ